MNRTALALPLLLLVLLAGCGSSSSSSSSASSGASGAKSASAGASGSSSVSSGGSGASGGGVQVTMASLKFAPATIHVKVGQTVKWTNQDSPPHNVTYQSGPQFKSSPPVMNPGSSYSVTFTQPGTITYFCSIHPFMKGTIVVSK